MLTTLERREATQDRELARRTLAKSRRIYQSGTLAPLANEQLAANIDDLERECAMLGTLLADNSRTGAGMLARSAGENETAEERPYQAVAR